MFTLVVSNRKGGTAKTTTAVNLAAEYAHQGYRSLLIDLDAQGHSGIGLGFQPLHESARPQSILANGRQTLQNLLHETRFENLFYIAPGNINEKQTLQAERLHRFLSRKQLAASFDIVIIDTPPHAGIEQTASLMAADGLIIPFLPSPLGKAGVQQLISDLKNIKPMNGKKTISYGLIPIMMDTRVNLDKQILSDLIAEHGSEKLLRGVRRNVKLAEAFDAGEPVNVFAARSRGAFDYHMLAEDIAGLWPAISSGQSPLSFREKAQVSTFPAQRRKEKPANTSENHRGIRLKDRCVQWNS